MQESGTAPRDRHLRYRDDGCKSSLQRHFVRQLKKTWRNENRCWGFIERSEFLEWKLILGGEFQKCPFFFFFFPPLQTCLGWRSLAFVIRCCFGFFYSLNSICILDFYYYYYVLLVTLQDFSDSSLSSRLMNYERGRRVAQKGCPTIFCFWEYLRCTLRFSEPSWWSFSETWCPFFLPLRIRLPQTANVKLLHFLLRELPCRPQSQNITHFFGGVCSPLNICLSLSPSALTLFFFPVSFSGDPHAGLKTS